MPFSYQNDSKKDERLNPSADTARNLRNREDEAIDGYDRKNDGLDDHPVSAGDASGKSGNNGDDNTKNIDDVKEKENEGGGWTNKWSGATNAKGKFDLKGTFKKNGPIGAIILLLGGGGIAITGLLSPSLLLVQITDIFTNNYNDAHPSLSVRTNTAFAHKVKSVKNAFAETSDGKCGIRCKFGTVSDTMRLNLEAKGYDVEYDQKKFGRVVITKLTLPDGQVINNGNDFKKAMRDPTKASQFHRVYNSRTAYFLNSKFGSMLATKLGINKAYKLVGDSKEKFRESFRRSIGLPPSDSSDPNRNQTEDEKLKNNPRLAAVSAAVDKLRFGTRPTNFVAAGCFAYNTSRAASASVKVAKMATYAAVVMTFFNAAHKLKAGDGGGIDPLVASELGDRLTYADPDPSSDTYKLDAMSSHAYKSAAYGDTGPLPAYAAGYSMESSGVLAALGALTFFAAGNETARKVAHSSCSAAGEPAAAFIQCAPTALTVIGYFACAGLNVITGAVIGEVIAQAMPHMIAGIVKANTLEMDENTKGYPLGQAFGPGAASILGGQAGSYGMKAGSKEEIAQYVTLSQEVKKQDEAIARVEAKEAPFDVYNQYSFLGSMVRNMNIASYANSSLPKTAGMLAATIPKSIASLTTTTNAGTYMPLNDTKADQYGSDNCPETKTILGDAFDGCCPALELIGLDGDAYCMPAYVKSSEELNADIDGNLNYMIKGNFIDEETGAPKKDPENPEPGRQFQLFVDHCVNRIDALGETSQAIEAGESGDYEWFIGANCSKNTPDIIQFRIYAMDEPIMANLNGERSALLPAEATDPNAAPSLTTENSGNVVQGGWTFPTTKGTPLGSPFGPRGPVFIGPDGKETQNFHTGIDLTIGAGSPFYATRDGVVTTKEYNVYSIMGDGGAWCPVLGLMSDPNQKDIYITHTVDGQTYTSVYAHMSRYLKRTGEFVKAGDLIGYTGGSGCSSGPHVHFEIWKGEATPSIPGPGMLDPWPLINP